MRKLLLAASAFILISLPSLAFSQAEIGKAAPSFTAAGADGKTHTLAEFKGKFVVLEWYNPECPFVKKHYSVGNMQSLQKEYTEKGVLWFSVNSSAQGKQGHLTPELARNLALESGSKASGVLLDHDGTIGKLYDAKTTPHLFIINPEGILIYAGAIDSDRSTKSERIASATNYVKAALDEALAGKPVTTSATEAYGCSVKY